MAANRMTRHRQLPPAVERSLPTQAKVVLALAALALVVVLPSVLLLAVGMLPTLAAYLTDRTREKYAALTIGGLNYCGVLPSLVELWATGHAMEGVARELGSPQTWLVMYGAAALGWGLLSVAPGMVAHYVDARTRARVERLRGQQRQLIEEWGPGVAGALDSSSEPDEQ